MLPDVLAPNLGVVFCGTAAGHRSASIGHYYAGRGNRFWQTLCDIGLTPRLLHPHEDAEVLKHGIGLTDLAKGVAGMDREIASAAFAPERLRLVLDEWRPRRIAFTSITAARIGLGLQGRLVPGLIHTADFPGVEIWALPSPSGAARGYWSLAPWEALAKSISAARLQLG